MMIDCWLSSHEFQVSCARNKSNRSKQTMTKTTGTRSFARVRAEQAEILGHEPSAWEMFKVTHKKKDGSMVDSTSKEIVEKIQSLVTQRAEEEPSQAIDENEIFSEVMGRERQGRVRGYGFGPTHSSVLGKIPSRRELVTELEQMQQHNNGLKNEMQLLEEKNEALSTKLDQVKERQSIFEAFMEDVRA
ncbi:uncharacterized protein LOC127809558 [Diospyros lotus]|uniref:uncharacterized protein LOC127809558 n=1 Tax=Diospyros lotus TaxID=55363 RepID=UPI0022590EEB|nr:uncharacterized protein LOC127809558 [Diospyros lotus]XP_052204390.1 uncharacterized protein LOC127809558 [Diospyros lotus]